MKRVSVLTILFILFLSVSVLAQLGGKKAYTFLNLSPSARVAGLGGNLITVNDGDLSASAQNPASINATMHNKLSLSYFNYFAGINYGMANYAFNFKKAGTFTGGIQYANYGKFTLADETSVVQGDFRASDYCLNIGYAKPLDSSFTIGMNFKTIYSSLYTYSSLAFALDVAGMYSNSAQKLVATALIRNAGVPLKVYYDGSKEKLPLEFMLGVSKGLKHVPITFHLNINNLQTLNLNYVDSSAIITNPNALNAQTTKEKEAGVIDKTARHLLGAVEIAPAKSFSIRIGYDYRKRKEMLLTSRGGIVGFSFGFGVKVKKFKLDYGRTQFHLAGASNLFTVSFAISDFTK